MKHVLSADQFSRSDLDHIMKRSAEMADILALGGSKLCDGKILGALFYEPSTRTRLSFETAMMRLGGKVISETDVTFSSQTKGEVIEDTIRIVGGYADIIAIRTKQKGEAKLAAHYSPVPVLNGGDGSGEHPTQSLLDLYTIFKHHKIGEKPLNVTFVGDLKYGRTVHSLAKILRQYEGVNIQYVAPEEIQMPEEYIKDGDSIHTELHDEILQQADVIYDTRMQKERFEDVETFNRVRNAFIFTPEMVGKMKPDAILMHPLPRVNEIQQAVDKLPQAKYFEQALNGVPVRMALIAEALEI
ncbi:aspartate carbamoyltransferase catalytic subunit [Rubritalea halochordaticola]|uniref:Aspartate carbamoyltransferase n=1 Tax=Rubritalea halochordaticola TaxID=714537 RepID=A0ABP9V1Y6_9BACT